ncbi:MAG: hypothetical protein GF418_01390 [Chitinivibrionales bacterium]|nr:hypothetical protein [Chitinivibrionales bacterium]MBD3394256.1 hypothetical protein [Chitinivibrionales bacterium]
MRSFSMLILCAAFAAVFAQDKVFYEQDGLIVVEAESVDPTSPWVLENDNSGFTAGFTGTGYFHFTGNNESLGDPNGIMTYYLNVTNPGTYYLRIRSNKDPSDGDDTHANDCYVKLVGHDGYQGQFTKTFMSGPRHEWRWHTDLDHHGSAFQLPAGDLEFQIAGRSKNYFYDRFVFFKEGTSESEATDPSQPESQTTVSSGGGAAVTVTMEATDFPTGGTNYYTDGNWLAINPEAYTSATTETAFTGDAGTYDVTFHGVGENDGQSLYKVWVDDELIIDYQVPLSGQSFEEGSSYNETVTDIAIVDGAIIKVEATVHSSDGQEYSRGRWRKIVFEGEGGSVARNVRADQRFRTHPAPQNADIYTLNGKHLGTYMLGRNGTLSRTTHMLPAGTYLMRVPTGFQRLLLHR